MKLRIDQAIDVFTESFAFVRSLTRPAQTLRHGPLWIVRDDPAAPLRKNETPRLEEVFTHSHAVEDALAALQAYAPRGRHMLGLFETPAYSAVMLKAGMKAMGYRLCGSETFFVCDLSVTSAHWKSAPQLPAGCVIRRVTSPEEAREAFTAIHGRNKRSVQPGYFAGARPQVRMYYAVSDGMPVAHALSVHLHKRAAWVHDVFTLPAHRRRGLAGALMNHMLRDDAAHGAAYSVLLASHTGALLYPQMGYAAISNLLMFMPAPRKSSQPAPRR
jgi:GNAT superfamily N-acetyltransferase